MYKAFYVRRLLCPGFFLCICLLHAPSNSFAAQSFVSVSEHGFDEADNKQDFNDYPWSMLYFTPDGSDTGYLYAGTGNSVMNNIMYRIGVVDFEPTPNRPPEIRRYRPDLGTKTWERVFDDRDIESGPDWQTSGFRSMASYTSVNDDVTRIYAGTYGNEPALWRSKTGDPGTWERFWSITVTSGSIRALTMHNGLLYMGITNEVRDNPPAGKLYKSSDGVTWELIFQDGLGNPSNFCLRNMCVVDDQLFLGMANIFEGLEIFRSTGH
ncbi:MAG: hypothetical protein WCQ99_16815 [Pseudomonadota bacterium]